VSWAAPYLHLGGHYGWFIETAFQERTVHLACEVNTLGYPKAALFGFAVAVVAYNALAAR
jgi:hypothetical protein